MDTTIRKKVKGAIKTLSGEISRVTLDFISYLSELDELEATGELLSDKKLLMDYKTAKEEIKKGNTVKWNAIKRNI